jgi:zinc and cadmium transporter
MLWAFVFGLLGSVGAILGAALLLGFHDPVRNRLLPCLISYAAGALLGAAFLGMIPKALEEAPPLATTGTVLAGIVIFFLLEKLLIWRHCHDGRCEVHTQQGGRLILVGDTLHNFIDGVVIAAAFLTSVQTGIAASLAIIAHEIPQELGDFAILLASGMKKIRAFTYNLLSSLATLPGVLQGGQLHLYCRGRSGARIAPTHGHQGRLAATFSHADRHRNHSPIPVWPLVKKP